LIAGLVVLYVLSVLINLGHLNLMGEEPRRAIISIEMLQSGEFVVPHALGWEYYNKPPLFNWILAGFMYLIGSESEFVARLPSLLFLLIWGFCHYKVCRKWFSKKLSILSTFFLLTSADIFFYGLSNGAEIDIFYSLIVYLQAISMFWFYEQKKWGLLFILSWFFCGIGFLTKGLPSLVFQLLTLGALAVHARSIGIFYKKQLLAGIVLFVLITGSFFYIYSKNNDPSVLLLNIINESLKKSAVGEESVGKLSKVFFYPLLFFKLLAPWSLILLVLLKKQKFNLFENPLVKFSLLFIVLNIGVYWITGVAKLRYIYMFVPFAMNVIVVIYEQFEKANPGILNKYLRYTAFIFLFVLGVVLVLPFFFKLNLWLIGSSATMLFFFLLTFFKKNEIRIWLLVSGLVITRLVYSAIGIPLQNKNLYDFRPVMASIAEKAGYQSIGFYLPADTLKLDVYIGGFIYKWEKKAVIVPPFLFHQIPYYFYRYSGAVLYYDTLLMPGKTYLSFLSHLKNKEIDYLYSTTINKIEDSLVLFRYKENQNQ